MYKATYYACFSQYAQAYLWELSFGLIKCMQKGRKGHSCIDYQKMSVIL